MKAHQLHVKSKHLPLAVELLRWSNGANTLPETVPELILSYMETSIVKVRMPLVLLPSLHYALPLNSLSVSKRLDDELIDAVKIFVMASKGVAAVSELEEQFDKKVSALGSVRSMRLTGLQSCVHWDATVEHDVVGYERGYSESELSDVESETNSILESEMSTVPGSPPSPDIE